MAQNLVIENARIIFRNFAGKEGKFNPAGRRNFSVIIDKDTADALSSEGWNIKQRPPRDSDDDPMFSIPVAVSFNNYPPKIVLIAGSKGTILDEEDVFQLDDAEIENADLVIRPYTYDVNGKKGVKAYLKEAYITIAQSQFDKKYANFMTDKSPVEEEDLPF